MALEIELKTYKEKLPSLLESEGKYVLIHGTDIAGIYTDQQDALKIGYEKFQLKPFLVKKIERTSTIFYFSRDFGPGVLHTATKP